MALSRRSGGRGETNTWPGFVDAMTALLLILMFVLSIFMIIQFTMHEKITGQTKELDDLSRQLAGLADVLALERDRSAELEGRVGELQSNLAGQRSETDRLTAALAAMTSRAEGSAAEVDRLNAAMAALVRDRDTAAARAAALDTRLSETITEREALEAALASARTEMDAAAETARLAAARREAMEALVAELRARSAARDEELAAISAERAGALALIAQLREERADREQSLGEREKALQEAEARREQALALIAELEAERAALRAERDAAVSGASELEKQAAERAEALAKLEEAQAKLTAEEQARLLELTAAETLRNKLSDLEARLTAQEEARLVEAAAAEALKKKLEESETELDAMTLALEKARKDAEETLTLLAAAEAAKKAMQGQLDDGGSAIDREATLRQLAEAELAKAKDQTLEEQKRVALLNAQVRELREQLGGLQALLEVSEQRDAEAQVQIAKLGERLNAALAQKVGQLARFRSVFFEKMDQVLGGRQDIQRVGDRFVFQSEVLFAPGSADLGPEGRGELAKLGTVLREVAGEMPADLNWILRVDGHTDKIPVGRSARYRDNWELSQARALSVVRYLIEQERVPADRLAATGFGEFQPIDSGDSREALAKNRRIEFKFTER